MAAKHIKVTFQLPPGKLGVELKEDGDGSCIVVSKKNQLSPLQVGDVIQTLSGNTFALHRQHEWVGLIEKATEPLQMLNAKKHNDLKDRVGTSITNKTVAERVQRLETSGKKETEAQKRLREMKEARQNTAVLDRKQDKPVKRVNENVVVSPSSEESGSNSSLMVSLLDTTMAKVVTLEEVISILKRESAMKDDQCKASREEMKSMERELGQVKKILEEERIEKAGLQNEAKAKEDLITLMRDEGEKMRKKLKEIKQSEESSHEDLALVDTIEQLQTKLNASKQREESMRNHISQLDIDKGIIERERDDARKEALVYKNLTTRLQDEVTDQLSSIDALVNLLERSNQITHNNEVNGRATEEPELQLA